MAGGSAPVEGDGSLTTDHRIVMGPQGPGGWRPLEPAPGEGHVVVNGGRTSYGGWTPLLTVAHLSDVHICDAESPARLEYLDHLSDPGEPYAEVFVDIGTYRPQEILTAQVAFAMVQRVNSLTRGPLGGAPLDAVLVTGDVIDNAQANELDIYRRVFGGGEVVPRSGSADSSWVGAPTSGVTSDRYWHPEGDQPDVQRLSYGYPTVPGLVEAARVPFVSPGVHHPWLTVHGNHDLLLQGTVAPDARTRAQAVGGRRVVGLAPGQTPYAALEAIPGSGPARYVDLPDSPTVAVPADPSRRLLERGEVSGWWARDVGEVRLLALDTVNPWGGWEGSLDEEQLDWLRGELETADRPVVITSHHPSWCLTNAWAPAAAGRRVLADEVLALLLAQPRCVLWIAGHVHANVVRHHPSPAGGLLEVTTASLIDWPQQGRLVELLADPSGTGYAVALTLVDHDGWWPEGGEGRGGGAGSGAGRGGGAGLGRGAGPGGTSGGPAERFGELLSDPLAVAGLSRLLSANDYRERKTRTLPFASGALAGDRNAVWSITRPS